MFGGSPHPSLVQIHPCFLAQVIGVVYAHRIPRDSELYLLSHPKMFQDTAVLRAVPFCSGNIGAIRPTWGGPLASWVSLQNARLAELVGDMAGAKISPLLLTKTRRDEAACTFRQMLFLFLNTWIGQTNPLSQLHVHTLQAASCHQVNARGR